jgi:transmembrane sensor
MTRISDSDADESIPVPEQAAHWWIVLHEDTCTAADREAFAAWLRRSPERVEAYLRVKMLMETLRSQQHHWPETPADELIRHARGWSAEIIPFARSRAAAPVPGLFAFLGARMFIYVSFAVVCCVVMLSWLVWSPQQFATDVGEQRSVLLDDGSVITLNTSSQIEVKYSDSRRFIRLVRGEALFDVAHDAHRPFDVDTGKVVVRAVGTRFNVDRRDHRTTVSVVEGKVQVMADESPLSPRSPQSAMSGDSAHAPAMEVLIEAQRLVVTDSGMGQPEVIVDIAPVTAWTQRQLVFENQTLGEVAAEFNRYNRQHILIESARLRSQLVTGVFQANDPASFLGFISNIPQVRVTTSPAGHFLVALEQGVEATEAGDGPKVAR